MQHFPSLRRVLITSGSCRLVLFAWWQSALCFCSGVPLLHRSIESAIERRCVSRWLVLHPWLKSDVGSRPRSVLWLWWRLHSPVRYLLRQRAPESRRRKFEFPWIAVIDRFRVWFDLLNTVMFLGFPLSMQIVTSRQSVKIVTSRWFLEMFWFFRASRMATASAVNNRSVVLDSVPIFDM